MSDTKPVKPLTGRKVLIILLSAFGVILTANMTLLYSALHTFPGLEVKNSYVASQTFDDRAVKQRSLGWTPEVEYADGQFNLTITADGAFVFPETISVRIGRPTHGREDINPVLLRDADGYWANVELDEGKWFVYVSADTADGHLYKYRAELFVAEDNG